MGKAASPPPRFRHRYCLVGPKSKLLGQPLAALLGMARDSAPVYGSSGFTSYSDAQLETQFGDWIREGIPRVKLKVGSQPERDLARVKAARDAIGADTELFVDANGAYSRKQALGLPENSPKTTTYAGSRSRSAPAISMVCTCCASAPQPAGMDIAAGEYGWRAMPLKRMLEAEAVDVLQADATRCGGGTRLHGCRGACGRTPAAAFRALRAQHPHAPGLRRAPSAPGRVFP